ncbi:hypothetical protein EAH79_01840 [Sphingomonas koreensis]|nr:hypothetical protein EAH79_01840 [Sphingomonas koreensis]
MHTAGSAGEPQTQMLVSLSRVARHLQTAGFVLGDAMRENITAKVAPRVAKATRPLVPAMGAVNCLINPASVLIGGRLPPHLVERLATAVNELMARCASYLPAIGSVTRAAISQDVPTVGAAILACSRVLPAKRGALWKPADSTAEAADGHRSSVPTE